jgi:putative ABC transport system permease protein
MKTSRWAGLGRVLRIPGLRRVEREIDDELRFHLDSRIAELIAGGKSPDEAWRVARAEFGDLEASKRELAEVDSLLRARERRADLIDIVRQDARYAVRGFRRQPALAAGIVLTLAIAVGANGAVYTLIDPLFFRVPPGLQEPSSVRRLYTVNPGNRENERSIWRIFSYREFRAIRDELRGSARVAVFASRDSVPVRQGSDSAYATVSYVTADFLPMLARPARGRFFMEREDDVNSPLQLAVISERFAARHYGTATDPLGLALDLDGKRYEVIGVASGGFEGIEWSAADVWVPYSTNPRLGFDQQPWYERGGVALPLVMRLAVGANEQQVTAKASLAYARSYQGDGPVPPARAVLVGPLAEARAPIRAQQEVRIASRLAVVAAIVLLVACANVTNLLLARAMSRRREFAVRLALGVSRQRLASQLVVEALLLAVLSSAAALLVTRWSGGVLRATLLPRVQWIGPIVDGRVVVFAILLTLVAALLAAAIPALRASRPDLLPDLKGAGHDPVPYRSRLRATLLVVQTALSMMLLVGTALFVRSLDNVRRVDMGFDTSRLVVASAFFADQQRHPERETAFPETAARLRTIPGIAGVAYGAGAPLYSWYSFVPLYVSGQDSAITTPRTRGSFIGTSSGYFAVAGTRILAGRGIEEVDTRTSMRVMVIGETMARTFWPDESPLGKCVSVRDRMTPCYTIVGVAEDVHGFRRLEESNVHFYLPIDQMPSERTLPNALVVRAGTASPKTVSAIVRSELAGALPGARISAQDAESALAPELRPWRLGAQLFAALGALALIVAAIGVYSVVAFTVRQRAHELGVRIALGARTPTLLRMVVGHGAAVVGIGVAVGTVGAAATGRFVSALLYGVKPGDPLSIILSAITLLVVGVIATLGPAIRSSRVDPAVVLRHD